MPSYEFNAIPPETVVFTSQADPTLLKEEDDQIKAFDLKLTEDDFEIVKASELFK